MRDTCFESIRKEFVNIFSALKRPDGSFYIFNVPKSEAEIREIANTYISDVILEPETFIPLPTAKTLDYKRYFKKYSTNYNKNISNIEDLRFLLNMTEYRKNLWDEKERGILYLQKLKVAATVCARRVEGIKLVAKYFFNNEDFHPIEAVKILMCFMWLHIANKHDGTLQKSKIKVTNQHSIMPISEDMAFIMRDGLQQGLSVKKAMEQGFVELRNKRSIRSLGQARLGWFEFPQSDNPKDIENLQIACAGSEWCTEEYVHAKDYLSEGSFWIYFEEAVAEIAVYLRCNDDQEEVFGRGEDQGLVGRYKIIAGLFLEQSSNHEYKGSYRICEEEIDILTDILGSLSCGRIKKSLVKHSFLNLEHDIITFKLPDVISKYISQKLISDLALMIEKKDIIEYHQDETVLVHASIRIASGCDILNQITVVKGNLLLFGTKNLAMPKLHYVAGHLDARNSTGLSFPKLRYVGEIIDAVGSKHLETPHLKNKKKRIDEYE